jgi:hypothetical protein
VGLRGVEVSLLLDDDGHHDAVHDDASAARTDAGGPLIGEGPAGGFTSPRQSFQEPESAFQGRPGHVDGGVLAVQRVVQEPGVVG